MSMPDTSSALVGSSRHVLLHDQGVIVHFLETIEDNLQILVSRGGKPYRATRSEDKRAFKGQNVRAIVDAHMDDFLGNVTAAEGLRRLGLLQRVARRKLVGNRVLLRPGVIEKHRALAIVRGN